MKKFRTVVWEYLTMTWYFIMFVILCGLGLGAYLFNVAIRVMQKLRFAYFKLLRMTVRMMGPSKKDKLKWNHAMWDINADGAEDGLRMITLEFNVEDKETR